MIYFIAKNNITIKTRNNTEHKTLGGAHLILSDYSLLRTMSVRHLHWKNGTEDRYTWCVQIHTLATGGKSGAKNIHIDIYIYIYVKIYINNNVCMYMYVFMYTCIFTLNQYQNDRVKWTFPDGLTIVNNTNGAFFPVMFFSISINIQWFISFVNLISPYFLLTLRTYTMYTYEYGCVFWIPVLCWFVKC